MSGFAKVATLGDLPPGTARMVVSNGKEIALYNVSGSIYATANTCPHQGGPLAEGVLDGPLIVCPWHAWTFDVTSGALLSPPNRVKIETYPVKVSGQDILVDAGGSTTMRS